MRKTLIILCFSTIILFAYSQNTNIPNVTPDNPQSQHFDKYINHSITEYNGLPNINIPLYEIDFKGLKIPIMLSYHASGIKHLQYDGDVGAGWSINAGGYRISRSIQGRPDDRHSMYDENKYKELFPGNGHGFGPSEDVDWFLAELGTEDYNLMSANQGKDGEYDLFSYSAPSTNGNFIILNRNSTNNAIVMEKNNDKITVDGGGSSLSLNGMQVVDENGFIFTYGGAYIDRMKSTPADIGNKSGWPMNKIESPDKTAIAVFDYKKYAIDFNPSKDKSGRKGMNYSEPLLSKPWMKGSNMNDVFLPTERFNYYTKTYIDQGFYGQNYDYTNGNQSHFINKITTDKEVITFIRKGSNTSAEWQDYMITEVRIEDKSGKLIKSYKFDYEFIKYQYTSTGSGNTPAYHNRRWHYQLKAITVMNKTAPEKKYQMEYYDAPQPTGQPLNSVAADQWGYYKKVEYPDPSGVTLHWAFNSDSIQLKYELPKAPNWTISPTLLFDEYENYGAVTLTHAAHREEVTEVPNYFSLKKIIYPAGGSTEYEYESNQYMDGDKKVKGAGLRTAKIVSHPGDYVTLPVTTVFKYGHNEDGNGIANIKLNEGHFANATYFMTLGADVIPNDQGGNGAIQPCMSIKPSTSYYSDPIIPDLPSVQVHYDKVNIYQYNDGEKKSNGRTEFIYKIPQQYEERIFNSNLITSDYSFYGFKYKEHRKFNPKRYGCNYIANYYLGYKPVLLSKRIYNSQNELLQSEEFEYQSTPVNTYKGIKSRQRIFFDQYRWKPAAIDNSQLSRHLWMYSHVNFLFDYNEYYLHAGRDLLTFKTSTIYTDNGATTSKEVYEYNDKLQVKKITRTDSENESVITHLKYPQDNASLSPYNTMVVNNMISPVIEEHTTKGTSNEKVSIKRTEYSLVGGSRIYPSALWISSTQDDGLRKVLTYDSYDSKGNLSEYTTIDGIKTTVFWGYKYQYPIIEVKNASYSQVKSALLAINATLIEANVCNTDTPDMANINKLREKLPEAMITTYTYKPLIGVLTVTNPEGITTYYSYDEFNRLKETYIMEGTTKQVVQEYKYNYQNK